MEERARYWGWEGGIETFTTKQSRDGGVPLYLYGIWICLPQQKITRAIEKGMEMVFAA